MTNTDYLQRLTLRSIHLHSCTHTRGGASPTADARFESNGEVQPIAPPDADKIAYLVKIDYKFFPASEDEFEPIATGDAAFIASYDLDEGWRPTEDQVEHFAFNGVIFQVHPYIREHLSTICLKSGMAPYLLPMLFRAPDESTGVE